MDAAVASAAKAQKGLGRHQAAAPPTRVMMALVGLINRDMDKLAEAISREHGKTFPDAKGDVQRGLEVIEFCIGAPHLLKGEFTDSAGPGIDMYSMRQPLGVVAGITPFNFPAMIPLWKRDRPLAPPGQRDDPQAVRARPVLPDAAGGEPLAQRGGPGCPTACCR